MAAPRRFALALCALGALAAPAAAGAGDGPAPAAGPVVARPATVCDPCDPCTWGERRRGPIEFRDEFVLAQPRLTLPATTPDTLGCGVTSVRASFVTASSFGWRQSTTGEDPSYRAFLADAETRTFDVTAMRGLTDDLDLGLRLPLKWRGGGFLDEIIDWWHDLTSFITEDNMRGDFRTDAFRLNGTLDDGAPFDLDREKGTGLGNLEGIARWRFVDRGRDGLSAALVGRLTVPTGTGPFETGGVEVGAQLVAAHRLWRAFDVYGGIGGTWFSDTTVFGIEYEPLRPHAFLAIEWRPSTWGSFFAEIDWSTRLVSNVDRFPGVHAYLNLGAKIDVAPRTVLELGFTENLEDQQGTSDFGAWLGVEHRF